MEHLEAIANILAIIVPIFGGLLWVQKRIEKTEPDNPENQQQRG